MWNALRRSTTKRHSVQRVIATHPVHLFRIVQDVDSYSAFLPYCFESEVLHKASDGRSFDGRLRIGYPPLFLEEYVSHVRVVPEQLQVFADSTKSTMFDSLRCRWKLEALPDEQHSCQVDFRIAIDVSNPVVATVLDRVLPQITASQVEAFDRRCREIPYPPELSPRATK